MAVRRTLDRMRALDRAWNERRWDDYAEFLDEAMTAHGDGDFGPVGKRQHIEQVMGFCSTFPDARLHTTPYVELFSSHDGLHSCSIARLTGTAHGAPSPPKAKTRTRHRCAGRLMCCAWRYAGGTGAGSSTTVCTWIPP